MSGSYRTKPTDWLRIVWEVEGKLPPPKVYKEIKKRIRLDILVEREIANQKIKKDC